MLNSFSHPITSQNATAVDTPGAKKINEFGQTFAYGRAKVTISKGDCIHLFAPKTSGIAQSTPLRFAKAASESNSNKAIGFAVGTISASYWGYIQTGGVCDYVKTDKGVVGNDILKKDQATAGMADTCTAVVTQTHKIIGLALDTDSGSICPSVLIRPRY